MRFPNPAHQHPLSVRTFLGANVAAMTTLVATGLLLGSASLAAQSTPSGGDGPEVRPEIYTEVVEVDLVNVDVYVRDGDGNPVEGLTKDDFELFVSGKPVAISNFYAVKGGTRTDLSEDELEELEEIQNSRLPINADYIERQRALIPPDQRLHIVIYIDNFNLSPFKRNRVISEVREFLRTELEPTDEVMLVSYDRSLNLREPFTFRGDDVSRALMELEDISAQRIHRDRERTDLMRLIEDSESAANAFDLAADYAGSFRNDVYFSLDALRSIIDGLAGSPGRKAVLYVSEGLPMIAGEDIFQQIQMKFKEEFSMTYAMEYDMSGRFREVTNQANANRISFYTIDARGLTVLTQGTVDSDIKGQAGEGTLIDSINNSNLQSTIQLLAERTGGKATINANRFMPGLKSMAADFRNYYSLGFLGTETSDGRYHQFDVRLKNKPRGWTVRHRDGYRSKSVETKMHDFTMSALNLDLQDNPLEAQIVEGPQRPRGDGTFDVPIIVAIPRDKLTFLPVDDGHYARVRLWLAAKDTADGVSPMRQIPVEFNLSQEQYEIAGQRGVPYRLDLQLEPGYNDFALGIRDELGATISYFRKGIRVGGSNR